MTKIFASLIHLAISATVALCVFLACWFIWYPSPFFTAIGGVEILLIMLGVDVVLGPLLTFIVFSPGKKSLKFDLSCIGLLQCAALVYGMHTMWIGRPVYIASLGHRFDLLQAAEIQEKNLKIAGKSLPKTGPVWVGIKIPADPDARQKVMWESITGGGDYGHLPQYHADISVMAAELKRSGEPIQNLAKYNQGREQDIAAWLATHQIDPLKTKFQGLKARSKDMTVIIDADDGKILGIAPFTPWPN